MQNVKSSKMGAVPIFVRPYFRPYFRSCPFPKGNRRRLETSGASLRSCGQTVVRLRASSLRMREIAGEEFQFRLPDKKKLHACMISKGDHEKEHGVYNRKKRRIGNKTRSLFYRLIRNISAFGFRAWRPYRSLNSKKQVM